jgi:hypothetical protein
MVAHRHLAGGRVEVDTAGQVRLDRRKRPLGVGAAVVVLFALPAGLVAPSGLPPLALAVFGRRDSLAVDRAIPAVVDA